MWIGCPHIALPLNVGFAHGGNVSNVTDLFRQIWCYRPRQAASLQAGVFWGVGCSDKYGVIGRGKPRHYMWVESGV